MKAQVFYQPGDMRLITHQVSLEDTLEGLQTVKSRKGDAMKGIMIFS